MPKEASEINLIIIAGTLLLLLLVSFIVLFMLFYQRRYFKQERKINQIKENAERELLMTQIEIQEIELKRVSQEIHDNTGQMLSLAKLNLNVLQSRMPADEPNIFLVKETKALVSDIINDLRNLSKSLSADMVERLGFVQALQFETERLNKIGQFNCQIQLDGNTCRLSNETEIILFRIAQESIQNIIKHSKAKNIDIGIHFKENELNCTIKDDGIGFQVDDTEHTAKNSGGSGLRNFYSRAKLIGAIITIKTNKGMGTCIELSLPLERL